MQREFSHLLRKAHIDALSSLTYKSVSIPVTGEYMDFAPAIIPIGNMNFSAYCILKNQTENDDSLKCSFNSRSSIQLHIVTKFLKGTGSELQCEEISDLILQTLFISPGVPDLFINGFNVWSGRKEGGRIMVDEFQDSRIFTKILILSYQVQQTEVIEPIEGNLVFDYSFDFSLS